MRHAVLAAAALIALMTGTARADILLFKNGAVIECKVQKTYFKKVPGQGGPKEYLVVTLEDGKSKEYLAKDVAQIILKKPSWVLRAEEKDWYAKESPKVEETWKKQEEFAKKCKQKKYLDSEALVHFKKAYELRKSEIKPEIDAHANIAKMLESSYGLFDEAKDEWRWVYDKKKEVLMEKEAGLTPAVRTNLANWCVGEGLYDEAMAEYEEALKADPKFSSAKTGMEKLRKALEVPVNTQLLRLVKAPLVAAERFLKTSQNQDGSFGSDIKEAGVHGHHGMSALSGLALLAKWEFDVLDNFERANSPPPELLKLLQWVLTCKTTGDGLRGPDVWGPIFRLELLARLMKKTAFASKKEALKARAIETIQEMKPHTRPDGGWSYYDFVKTGTSFVTAAFVNSLVEAREAGVPVDDAMIAGGCSMVKGLRKGPGQFVYHAGAMMEDEVGCAGRSSLCELALARAGQGGDGITMAIDNFFKHQHLLDAIKGKAGTHIGEGKTAPYYFLYDHYWTTRALKMLPKSQRIPLLRKMADLMLREQEAGGEFWDTPLTKDNKVCGTALGALCIYQIAVEPLTK